MVPLVLPAPVPDVTGPLLMVPPLVVLPVVPEVEEPPPAGFSAWPAAAPASELIESCSVLEVPLISELPLASESVATSPDPVLGSLELLPPLQELKERAAPNRAVAKKLIRGLYMVRGLESKETNREA